MKKMPYNLNYRICADYDFQYKLYNQQHATFKSVNVIVSSYEAEQGVSSVHIVDLKKEVADIHGDRGSFSWKLKFMLWLMDYMMRGLVKNMLPKSWLIKIRRCKHC